MSLFNSPAGTEFDLDAELPIEGMEWQIGLVVGPSGSGKTSLGRQVFASDLIYEPTDWPEGVPIIDAIDPGGSFDAVTGALSAVGLGTVPSWLRPYSVLSRGEQFRANLARLVCEKPAEVVVDEFTSVVDRQIARIGAMAFSKAWRRTEGRVVLLSCHYDILEWVQPDWVYDTAKGEFTTRECLQPRPRIEVEVQQTDWRYWPLFEPHHYLKVPRMIAAKCYVATVDGEPVAHLALSTKNKGKKVEGRACRLVVMPEWQGAGVGLRFLNLVCQHQLEGGALARLPGLKCTSLFHTSHPGLAAALRRDPAWRQLSAVLHGAEGNAKHAPKMSGLTGGPQTKSGVITSYGGHFRAVQGFRRYGTEADREKARGAPVIARPPTQKVVLPMARRVG